MTPKSKHQHTNHLIEETSPYLLQHAHNPVDWYPWGPEALTRAKSEDKPIFLSIGYAACHWCHVMERESFEDEAIAAVLNREFINIKVDREQRPDLDQIYMAFTTALTGSGGWPMSVFLTHDLKPFFAGTYFPPVDGYGRPSFGKVITEVARSYRENPEQVVESAEGIFDQVSSRLQGNLPTGPLTPGLLERSAHELMRGFDPVEGGFGNAPKFPHALELALLLRHYRQSGDLTYLNAVNLTLSKMARGGIYDQLGGGFARYSTDRDWLAPHFEKMLYDNGLLIPLYAEAYRVTGDSLYLRVVRESLDWLLREMVSPDGGFYSTLDADSEGAEGKFYVWSEDEITALLDPDEAAFVSSYWDISRHGNWEGHSILRLTAESERAAEELGDRFEEILQSVRTKLMAARDNRVRPGTDDKILVSWNGLALSALCHGYQITGEGRYLDAAIGNAEFVRATLFRDNALTHAFRDGRSSSGQFLEDYAYYAQGLLDLYESDAGPENDRWLTFAVELADRAIELFQNDDGRWYLRPEGHDDLIMRPRDETDSSVPAPGSIMIGVLLKLNRITGKAEYLSAAEHGLKAISGQLNRHPSGMASAVAAVDYHLADKIEIVIVGNGDQRDQMLGELYRRYLPNAIIAAGHGGASSPLLEGRTSADGRALAYVCRNSVCQLPVGTVDELKEQLRGF